MTDADAWVGDLDPDIEELARQIVDAAIEVHRFLGPGMLESVYEDAFKHELELRGLHVERQVHVPVQYKGHRLRTPLRLDLLVEGVVIVELKAVETVLDVHLAQVVSYLRAADRPLGFLLNFNVPLMRDGIYRRIGPRTRPPRGPT